ncbi:hypothetical protein SAMN05444158_1277 [Bradyrhizobium canariense]|uniref:Uncharacterized protein n=1 Tax=Bradyrhizobium canariense TaxID=255045 RepID=A0A1H1Q573_9BRAD|nr:hypothetical protein SAMN05444158_1277 [Bradyrhizobium canariense]
MGAMIKLTEKRLTAPRPAGMQAQSKVESFVRLVPHRIPSGD